MPNDQGFKPGDFLVFQVESGFGLLRVLDVEDSADPVWHVAVYRDLFQEIDYAEFAIASPDSLSVDFPHIALTNRAFESTQVSRLGNRPLTKEETSAYESWRREPAGEVSDRSIRLTLGLR